MLLGNKFGDGKPIRQESNYCYTDDDCKGIDKYTGKKKQGMSCNHYYKGPDIFERNGLCQVQYESNGRRYYLYQPPGWKMPLNEPLKECNVQSDCGVTGINGWSRCVGGASDGKKYCLWPGKTYTPTPKDMAGQIPRGVKRSVPMNFGSMPTGAQAKALNLEAREANNPLNQPPGGSLRNVSGPPANPSTLYSHSSSSSPSNIKAFNAF